MGLINRFSPSGVSKDVRQRRQKVAMYISKQFTEQEIADLVGVSQATISGDVKAIREFGDRFAYTLAKDNGMAVMMAESIDGLYSIIRDLELLKVETYEIQIPNPDGTLRTETRPRLGGNAMVMAHKIQMDCFEKIFELSKNGPFVIGVAKARQDFEKIKKSVETKQDVKLHAR